MKILVIRITHIGDCVVCLPIISEIKKRYPEANIDYMVAGHIAPLFVNHPDIDRVITFNQEVSQSFFKTWALAKKLRSERYDVVIDLRVTIPTALVTWISGAKRRYGASRKITRRYAYHKSTELDPYCSVIDSYLAVLSLMDIKPKEDVDFPNLFLMDAEIKGASKLLNRVSKVAEPLLIGVNISSRRWEKTWPLDRYLSVLKRLAHDRNIYIVVIGTKDERRLVDESLRCEDSLKSKMRNDIEYHSIRDAAAMLANCDLYFGNDTGLRHIAQALNIPTFAVFAPHVIDVRWLPHPGPRHRAVHFRQIVGWSLNEYLAKYQQVRDNREQYYDLIKPEIVTTQLVEMIDDIFPSSKFKIE